MLNEVGNNNIILLKILSIWYQKKFKFILISTFLYILLITGFFSLITEFTTCEVANVKLFCKKCAKLCLP